MFLKDIKAVESQINFARADYIKSLHNLIFKTDNGTQNRKDLRVFTGFNFKEGDDEFTSRLTETLDGFSQIRLISIANYQTKSRPTYNISKIN